jgi:hypothetical protein
MHTCARLLYSLVSRSLLPAGGGLAPSTPLLAPRAARMIRATAAMDAGLAPAGSTSAAVLTEQASAWVRALARHATVREAAARQDDSEREGGGGAL